MSTVAHALLQSQQAAHAAAAMQRLMLTNPAEYDTPANRAEVLDTYAWSRHQADLFAIGTSMHPAANDSFATGEA